MEKGEIVKMIGDCLSHGEKQLIAKYAGVTPQHLSNVLSGKTPPGRKLLKNMIKYVCDRVPPQDDKYIRVENCLDRKGGGEQCRCQKYMFSKEWLKKFSTSIENLATYVVHGDCMRPLVNTDDVVLIDTGDTQVQDGELYAIDIDGEKYIIRRIRWTGSGNMLLVCDNQNQNTYPNEEVKASDVFIKGRILWIGKERYK